MLKSGGCQRRRTVIRSVAQPTTVSAADAHRPDACFIQASKARLGLGERVSFFQSRTVYFCLSLDIAVICQCISRTETYYADDFPHPVR